MTNKQHHNLNLFLIMYVGYCGAIFAYTNFGHIALIPITFSITYYISLACLYRRSTLVVFFLVSSFVLLILVGFFQTTKINAIYSYYESRNYLDLHVSIYFFSHLFLPAIFFIWNIDYHDFFKTYFVSSNSKFFRRGFGFILPVLYLKQVIVDEFNVLRLMLRARGLSIDNPISAFLRLGIWLPVLVRITVVAAIERYEYIASRHIDFLRFHQQVQRRAWHPLQYFLLTIGSLLLIDALSAGFYR